MNKIDFIGGNVKKCLFSMAIPMIIAMYLNMAYNLVDSIWIGNLLGEKAYAALANSTPIILLLTSIGMGATNGIAILLSQAVGSKNKEKIEGLIATSLSMSIVISIFITIILELFLKHILKWLNTPNELIGMAYDYLKIYVLGYFAVYLYLYFTAVLRSFGDSMFQVISISISTVLNTLLDPIFIQLFGFRGAAIATILSQLLCLAFSFIYLRKKKLFKLYITRYDIKYAKDIIKKAIPSIVQQSSPAISTTFLTALVSSYSITAIAAYGISGKIETILLYPAMAFNMVLTTIEGHCIGAQRIDKAKSYLKYSIIYGCLGLFVLSIIIVNFSGQLSGIFLGSNEAARIVVKYFEIVGIGYVLNTITNCFLGSLNGIGKPTSSMILMFFYYIIVRIPLAYILSINWGLNGIWISVLVSHIAACVASTISGRYCMLKYYKK